MENTRVRFLFTSLVVSENKRVSTANEWVLRNLFFREEIYDINGLSSIHLEV